MPTRLTPHTALMDVNKATLKFLALPLLLFALQAEQLFLFSTNSDKTPNHTHLQHAKFSQSHRDDWPPFLLTVSCEAPPPILYHPFSAEAEKVISLLCTSGSTWGHVQMSQPIQNWNK